MNKRPKLIDYLFWITLILFTNPGGIQQAFNIQEVYESINLNDFLFVILTLLYLLVPKRNTFPLPLNKNLKFALLIFIAYYFIIFGYLTPLVLDPKTNVTFNFIKLRYSLYCYSLFFYAYLFWKRSWTLFIRVYLYSSILILLLFFQSLFSNWQFLPIEIVSRGFIEVNRNVLKSYGFMPWLTSFGVILIVFNIKTKYRFLTITGFILMNLAWIVSLTRRYIFGLIICFIIAYILYNYIKKGNLNNFFLIVGRILISLILLIYLLHFTFPTYVQANLKVIKSTLHVIRYGENITGQKDERLNLIGRSTIMQEFKKSPLFGTGFNNKWRTKEGDEAGFEASDYPFQAALAMAGLLGLLVFLPFYIYLIKMLVFDINFIRRFKIKFNHNLSFLLLSFILFLGYTLIQYMNWFIPLSNGGTSESFFVCCAFYIGTRELFYQNYKEKKLFIHGTE